MDAAIEELVTGIGVTRAQACRLVGRSRASHYRATSPRPAPKPLRAPKAQPRALSEAENAALLAVLHSDRFIDTAPSEAYAILLDEGVYLGSVSTMYRLLRQVGEVRERRAQAVHPASVKPELVAHAPNEVWSWDITKLHGPAKWTYYYLYVIIDIFSRYIVGWMLAPAERATLAQALIDDSIAKHVTDPDGLTLHADRGSSMASKPVAFLLADLGVTKSHARPHVPNDNPFSESQFKTMKYRPEFPGKFDSIEQARDFCRTFFSWYNFDHRHSGIGWHTAASVHFGTAAQIREQRAETLDAAYLAHPERFVSKPPTPPQIATTTWINKPEQETTTTT
jgi:putative transposase